MKPKPKLSPQQREVMRLVAAGKTLTEVYTGAIIFEDRTLCTRATIWSLSRLGLVEMYAPFLWRATDAGRKWSDIDETE